MALPLLGMLIGGAAGGGKSILDFIRAGKQRKLQAETTFYSPWTHMQAKAPDTPNPFGDVLSGAVAGGGFEQGINKATRDQAYLDQLAAKKKQEEDEQALLQKLYGGG